MTLTRTESLYRYEPELPVDDYVGTDISQRPGMSNLPSVFDSHPNRPPIQEQGSTFLSPVSIR